MPYREDILREKTHKDDGLKIEERVFYTLDDGKENHQQAYRNSRVIALLMSTLREKNILTDDDIEEILFECATR